MEKKNLLDLNLQLFGEEGEVTDAEVSEAVEPTEDESPEVDYFETDVEEKEKPGVVEPEKQSAEENARYAAIRRRAEDDARRKYGAELDTMNQQIAALCQGVTNPETGQPITNMRDYVDALTAQQRMAREEVLKENGIDPAIIDQAVASNPVVMQAQQVIERTRLAEADYAVQNDIAEISKIDPNIRGINDLAALPNFPEILDRVTRGANLVDAYKMVNFDNLIHQTKDAARQQSINEMRGKAHLPSQPNTIATENDDVEVPAEIMKSWKADGKSEKEIRDLYKKVAKQLNLN